MGATQGLTEFLPVSSSGHIVLSSAIYKLIYNASFNTVSNEEIFFDILIHLSTLFAVILYFFKEIKEIISGFFISVKNKEYNNDSFKFVIYILFATFMTGIIGFLIKDTAHKLTESPFIVSILLMVTGCILYLSEKFKNKEKKINLITSLVVGIFQGLAIFPGISRSGMTISCAVFMGVKRKDAAKFSFILSIPIILIASLIYPILSFDIENMKDFNYNAIITGMFVSFIVGYFCIKYFMKFVEKYTLKGFAYYCILVGFICAILFHTN